MSNAWTPVPPSVDSFAVCETHKPGVLIERGATPSDASRRIARGRVLDRVARLKDILFERLGDDLWQYAFVRCWDESANAYEDDVFTFSFRRGNRWP